MTLTWRDDEILASWAGMEGRGWMLHGDCACARMGHPNEQEHDRATPLVPFMLSQLSVRQMKSDDTLFVSANQE